MTCFFCKGDLIPSATMHAAQMGDHIALVKHVPCMQCEQCGEVVYTGDVARRLEELLDTLENSIAEVSVLNYQSKAA